VRRLEATCEEGRAVREGTLRFQKGDLVAMAIVVVLALAVLVCFLPRGGKPASVAEIYRDGALVETVALSQDRTLTVEEVEKVSQKILRSLESDLGITLRS
jgi:anti-sigma-K factor RskA